MRQLPLITGAICALAMAATAEAQTTVERVWIDVNVGSAWAAEDDFLMTASVDRAHEPADFAAHYHVPRNGSFDFGGGFMLTPIVGVGINVGGSAHEAQADLTVRVPHPYFLEAFASASAQTDIPMQRIERSLNVQVMLVALRTKHFCLRAFGGPSYFRIEQDSVTDIVYNQFYFVHSPGNVAELTEYRVRADRRHGVGLPRRSGRLGVLHPHHRRRRVREVRPRRRRPREHRRQGPGPARSGRRQGRRGAGRRGTPPQVLSRARTRVAGHFMSISRNHRTARGIA